MEHVAETGVIAAVMENISPPIKIKRFISEVVKKKLLLIVMVTLIRYGKRKKDKRYQIG